LSRTDEKMAYYGRSLKKKSNESERERLERHIRVCDTYGANILLKRKQAQLRALET